VCEHGNLGRARLQPCRKSIAIRPVFDENGDVKGMRVTSGRPLLIPATLSTVSKRKYEPTILDGERAPIDLRVEISFSDS
jgi:Gram-negative bacterial TonB protein C-terminal